jgi:hypothetical protein
MNISLDEKRWQAESDARALAEANLISKDKKRLAAAKKQANKMAKEKASEAAAMKNVAKNKAVKKTSKPKPRSKKK